MSQFFTMLVGLPGSGKSTKAKEWVERWPGGEVVIVSSDSIRKELWGDESIQEEPAKVFEVAHSRIRKYLKEGYDVIFDATNLSAKRRIALLHQIDSWGIDCGKGCAVIGATIEECIDHQNDRDRKVPVEVIWKMARSFQVPLKSEGWDSITIHSTGKHYDLDFYLYKCQSIPHDNHHHTLSIGRHMDATAKDIKLKITLPVLYYAAKFHDIGKYYTKTFTNSKGEPTEEAHYYGHQNVGAYMCLFGRADQYFGGYFQNRADIATLVQYHMEPYFRDEKGMKKLEQQLGDRLFYYLTQLHESDKAAHEEKGREVMMTKEEIKYALVPIDDIADVEEKFYTIVTLSEPKKGRKI